MASHTRITTPFTRDSSVDEVLAGVDLNGRRAIVTGGVAGIGAETARALASAGAEVTLAVQDLEAGERTAADIGLQTGNRRVFVSRLDLTDRSSVAAFTAAWDGPLHILVNNARLKALPELTRTPAGWEMQFATNHLGHFALLNLLWPAIVRDGGARVVSVSSGAHRISGIRWDDVQFEHGYDKWLAYGQSKTANALFAVHLDTLGRGHGVRAFAAHPGSILTPLQRHLPRDEMIAAGWIDDDGNVADPTFKTPPQGAATLVWAATATRLEGLGGAYCEDCDVAEPAAHAADPGEAARLWALSADLTGTG